MYVVRLGFFLFSLGRFIWFWEGFLVWFFLFVCFSFFKRTTAGKDQPFLTIKQIKPLSLNTKIDASPAGGKHYSNLFPTRSGSHRAEWIFFSVALKQKRNLNSKEQTASPTPPPNDRRRSSLLTFRAGSPALKNAAAEKHNLLHKQEGGDAASVPVPIREAEDIRASQPWGAHGNCVPPREGPQGEEVTGKEPVLDGGSSPPNFCQILQSLKNHPAF